MTTTDKALAILAGCPAGATEHAMSVHGIDRATLDSLVRDGRARMTTDTFANPRNFTVARFHIKRG